MMTYACATLFANGAAAGEAAAPPEGWFAAGSNPQNYSIGVDKRVRHSGAASAFIASKAVEPAGFGTLMQMVRADAYRGRRVCLSAQVLARDVSDWAGLWMRVDGPARMQQAFDNMQDRPIRGSLDWTSFSVVLDVPKNAEHLAFGVLLRGAGRVHMDSIKIETVDLDVPVTDAYMQESRYPSQPANLDFER